MYDKLQTIVICAWLYIVGYQRIENDGKTNQTKAFAIYKNKTICDPGNVVNASSCDVLL